MKRILFLIHDLGQGGAEKVLVNLVNNLDFSKYEITVMTLFGGGVNEQFLSKKVKLITIFSNTIPGNSKLMKFFSPAILHKLFIKDFYDVEIAYLEGPSARIISGSQDKKTKLLCWIHSEQRNISHMSYAFRSKSEAIKCYKKFDEIICVSESIKKDLSAIINDLKKVEVLYNTVESEKIKEFSKEKAEEIVDNGYPIIIAVGSLKPIKGFDRLLRVVKRLIDNRVYLNLYLLGKGPLEDSLKKYVSDNNLQEYVSFLGYQLNPYKYIARADLFVCSSWSEGFSTAVTEALIVGTPVCTVDVPGMKELLGEKNEYGVITKNSEDALYDGIYKLLNNKKLLREYQEKAKKRGLMFSSDITVGAVEKVLDEVTEQ